MALNSRTIERGTRIAGVMNFEGHCSSSKISAELLIIEHPHTHTRAQNEKKLASILIFPNALEPEEIK